MSQWGHSHLNHHRDIALSLPKHFTAGLGDLEEHALLGSRQMTFFSSRILKHLKAKDPVQLRLEHLEQGFSVYVNGANSELKTSPRKAVHTDFSRSASQAEGSQGECRASQARQQHF